MKVEWYVFLYSSLLAGLKQATSVTARHRKELRNACTYNVQVWNPDENIIQKIHSLELRQTIMETKIAAEIMTSQCSSLIASLMANASSFEAKLTDLHEQEAEMRADLLELNDKLKAMPHQYSQKLGGQQRTKPMFNTTVESQDDTILQMKNAIGDLRAEWLVIKRDVYVTKTDVTNWNTDITELRTADKSLRDYFDHQMMSNSTKLQEQLEKTSSKLDQLNNKYSSLANKVDIDFSARLEDLKKEIESVKRMKLRSRTDSVFEDNDQSSYESSKQATSTPSNENASPVVSMEVPKGMLFSYNSRFLFM